MPGGQRQHGGPIRQHEERDLLAFHELLDHDGAPGLAEASLHEAQRDGAVGLLQGPADLHALAGGEPIGLDHQRRAQLPAVAARGAGLGERPEARRRDPVARHEILGEDLRALEAGRRGARAEDMKPSLEKAVGEPQGQRQLGPHDGEVHALPRGDRHQPLDVGVLQRDAVGMPGDPRIPRRGEEPAEPRALGELPGERVLAAATADQQYSHSSPSGLSTPSRWERAIWAQGLPRSSSR